MDGRLPARSVEQLLAHAGWLNRLARHLVRDRDLADDLTQEAWAAAARSPPDEERPPRRWLAEVLRNVVRMHVRSGRRREHWERAAGATAMASAPSPDAAYEQLELHRIVVES